MQYNCIFLKLTVARSSRSKRNSIHVTLSKQSYFRAKESLVPLKDKLKPTHKEEAHEEVGSWGDEISNCWLGNIFNWPPGEPVSDYPPFRLPSGSLKPVSDYPLRAQITLFA